MPRGLRRRLDFEGGGLTDADDAAVGKLQRRATVGRSSQAVAGMQELVRDGGLPVIRARHGGFHLAGKSDEQAGGTGIGRWQRPGNNDGKHRKKHSARQHPAKRASWANDKSF